MSTTASAQAEIIKLVPGGEPTLAHLSDAELLADTQRLAGASNGVFAALLLHLAEVETRGIHRTRACASLYTYCIYELRMSEDAAARRSSAARLVKAFPPLFDAIAGGELHLTGLLMLGPHLTPENHLEVLARAKFRTKKEIAKLVRDLHPLPAVPDQIEPIGPDSSSAPRAANWNHFIESLCPPVRELPDGRRPSDWANDAAVRLRLHLHSTAPRTSRESEGSEIAAPARFGGPSVTSAKGSEGSGIAAPARFGRPSTTGPQQYRLQFCTSEEHVRLVEQAKALLARTCPGASLGDLHERAMQLLVKQLEKQKFALTDRPRKAKANVNGETDDAVENVALAPPRVNAPACCEVNALAPARVDAPACCEVNALAPARVNAPACCEVNALAPARVNAPACAEVNALAPERVNAPAGAEEGAERNGMPRPRGRSVPAGLRREVYARDGGRCGYVDERGVRCCETRDLQFHHLEAFAKGGEHSADNIALRCVAHNALAAEADFGRDVIEHARRQTRRRLRAGLAPARDEERPCCQSGRRFRRL